MKKDVTETISKILYKRAMGYTVKESVAEYVVDENQNELLSKKKVTTKHIPPDIAAAKTLLALKEGKSDLLTELTDQELAEEKARLLELLKEEGDKADDKIN